MPPLVVENVTNVPISPPVISFYHPIVDRRFLCLNANSRIGSEEPGLHYDTALNACCIIACNKPGYLSTSRNPGDINAKINPASRDSLLHKSKYFYHTSTGDNYPICLDFDQWSFPHRALPSSWTELPEPDELAYYDLSDDMTAISVAIRARDNCQCRVSHWSDSTTTAYIVPKEHNDWMIANEMECFTTARLPYMDGKNLFALRADLHVQFDRPTWVIVPKDGQMHINFVGKSSESAVLYHDQIFYMAGLSRELLFARFAWAVIKMAKAAIFNPKVFKTKAIVAVSDVEAQEEMGDDKGEVKKVKKTRVQPPRNGKRKRSTDKSPGLLIRNTLEDDLVFAQKYPFFLDPDGKADPYHYETFPWYPGRDNVVAKLKQDYIDAHPNVKEHSNVCGPSRDSDEEPDL